jgi:hypothetical protein
MMDYKISYTAVNTYLEPVYDAIFELNILPCNNHIQVLTGYNFRNSIGSDFSISQNLFGFNLIQFRAKQEFSELKIHLTADVRKNAKNDEPLKSSVILDNIRSIEFQIDHQLFLRATSLTEINENNKKKILKMGNKTPILLFLNTLNLYTHQYINYTQGATSVHTTANDIFNFPKGVCQDYAHLFIAVCRYNGIPARYVSGYIFPDDQLLGALQMHAWVEAFVPDIGWIGIDPTNNIFTDTNFIKVSHGTDYNDCSPIKGILNTSGNNTTVHDVHVELNTMNQQQQQQQQ